MLASIALLYAACQVTPFSADGEPGPDGAVDIRLHQSLYYAVPARSIKVRDLASSLILVAFLGRHMGAPSDC